MKEDYYLILAGGVGAAKFLDGLVQIVKPESLKIVINTGDDIELFGLYICPDLDIITYSLANLIDKEKGWGYENDSFYCLSILKKYYNIGWFNAGDKDLATHIYRTDLFKQKFTKAEITKKICEKLCVKAELIPMCNEHVETRVITKEGNMHFEEYFIKHKCELEALKIEIKNIEKATPVSGVLNHIKNAKRIIICPSNPIVSIGTILQVKGIKDALIKVKNKVFAISPIIEGKTVKGPADKFMKTCGLDVSSYGVASYYKDFLGHFVIDNKDINLKEKIEQLGIKTYCFDTLMTTIVKKKELAQYIINL